MTEITLKLTEEELKLIDKYVELNDETRSVFDKIKYAYPQPRMTLEQEGDYVVVSYNDTTYYRNKGETTCWYIKKGVSVNYPVPTFVMVNDGETERLLEGIYYNDIQVKKEKKYQPTSQTKSSAQEAFKDWWGEYPETGTTSSNINDADEARWVGFTAGYHLAKPSNLFDAIRNLGYSVDCCDEIVTAVERAHEQQLQSEKQERKENDIKKLVKESVKWCEENPNKNPLDCLQPKSSEQVADGLKEAFREAVKQGVVSSANKPQTLYDLIADWWDEIFMNNNEAAVTIESLVDDIEKWLPKEQSAEGSQNAYVESTVEGFNDALNKIKGKLR